jgi:hypothetical protein
MGNSSAMGERKAPSGIYIGVLGGDVSHKRGKRRKHGQEPATMEAAARLALRSGTHFGQLGLVDGSPL